MRNAMDIYSEAVERFKEYSAVSMDNLVKARKAYEDALRASEDIRKNLTSNDESIKSVMFQLQEIVSEQLAAGAEVAKLIEIRTAEEENGAPPAGPKLRRWL
jgi:DNA repair ATPase RecN